MWARAYTHTRGEIWKYQDLFSAEFVGAGGGLCGVLMYTLLVLLLLLFCFVFNFFWTVLTWVLMIRIFPYIYIFYVVMVIRTKLMLRVFGRCL